MKLDLRIASRYLEYLWTDKMTIYAMESYSDESGDGTRYPDEPTQSDIPCLMSFNTADDVDGSQMAEPVEVKPSIFCSGDVKVQAGDKVVVQKCYASGETYHTYTGYVSRSGEPNRWTTHQEFTLDLRKDA